jgi:hypothetical protein
MTHPTNSRKPKSRPAKPRSHRVIVVCAVAFALLLLLLRLLNFAHGRR